MAKKKRQWQAKKPPQSLKVTITWGKINLGTFELVPMDKVTRTRLLICRTMTLRKPPKDTGKLRNRITWT